MPDLASSSPAFYDALQRLNAGSEATQFHFVHIDQLSRAQFPEKMQAQPEETALLFCESDAEARRRPYHQKKLSYNRSAQRHFALECAEAGHPIIYLKDDGIALEEQLRSWLKAHKDAEVSYMQPAEWDAREALQGLAADFDYRLKELPNTFFMSDPQEWKAKIADGYVMEFFYRKMRKRTGYLMDGDKPEGGDWNYDKQNRKKLPKGKQPPAPVDFEPDAITLEVMEEISARFPEHWGSTDGFNYAINRAQALEAADDFFAHRFAEFGPYEDALALDEYILYHSALSIYMNNGLLHPQELCERALEAYEEGTAPINSVEGYIRQIIGWREYIRNYYEAMMPDVREANTFDFQHDIPESFWTGESKMKCISECVKPVRESGYSHHIPRLMVLSNYSNLTETDPRKLLEWFHYGYLDAWEWVVLPNVLGMSTFADGGVLASKPYVSSGNYINKMSNYCKSCAYSVSKKNGEKACPFNYLYWNFVDKHQEAFEENGRVSFMLNMLRKKSDEDRGQIREDSGRYIDALPRYSGA